MIHQNDGRTDVTGGGLRRYRQGHIKEGTPVVAEKEADGGDAGCAILHAGCGILFCDAAES
jgi:hypothetical protein